jgi:hypothetical protein
MPTLGVLHPVLQGWAAVARMVLPVAAADAACVKDVVQKMEQLTQGVPLLHLAVRSQNTQLVQSCTPTRLCSAQRLLSKCEQMSSSEFPLVHSRRRHIAGHGSEDEFWGWAFLVAG